MVDHSDRHHDVAQSYRDKGMALMELTNRTADLSGNQSKRATRSARSQSFSHCISQDDRRF